MGQFSKKVVSTVVTFATVLSSVGVGAFAVPSVASAATLMNGDLIKASGPAVYYYMDGQRYTFPTEKTYLSWFSDFSRVRTISDTELSGIQLAMKNVTMRPGTQLVKITTDPKVYAVTAGGVLRWIQGNEPFAASIFGSNWARRVVDVPDGFFTNYTIGAPITTAVHPDGTLVTYAGSADRFVVVGGQLRRVTDAGFSANLFQAGNVLSTTISYPMSSAGDVTMRESALSDAIMTSGSSTTPTPVGGSLTATLASDTPSAMVLPKNAQSVMFTKVNLTAGASAARVTGVKFHRVGVGSTTDFSNVYLYNANGTRLTSGRTISTATNMVEFNGLSLDIAAGSTLSVYLSADLASAISVTGGQHAFELADASSVVLSGTGSVSGSFPVRGNAMTVGTASVARVDVINGSTPADPRVGVADAELANFRLQANGTNDVQLRRVTLYQAGSVSNSDLSNLHLYQGSTDLGSVSSVGSDGKIVINFATPFLIPNGQSRTFNLRGSVAGRSGRTIRIYAEYSSDMYLVDSVYGVGAQVCTDSTSPCSGSYDGSSSGSTNASYSTTQGGQFTISFNGPATTNIGRGQNDAVFYRFAITSGSNDVEIRKFNFTVTTTGSGVYDGTTEYLRDIKIKDADTGEVVAGPVSCTSSCAAPGYKAFSTSVSVNVRSGQTRNFVVTADTSNSITDGSTYKFGLGGASSDAIFGSTDLRILSSGEFLTSGIAPNTTVTGNLMTVLTPSLNVTLAGTPSSGVYVKNQADIPASAFTITAGSQSDVRVTSLKVTGRGNTAGSYAVAQLYNVVNACGLFDGETPVGSRQSPSSTDGTMTFSSLSLSIARGTSKTLSVRCTADSTVTQTAGDAFAVGIALAGDISAQDADGNTVSPSLAPAVTTNAGGSPTVVQTVKSGGTLTVAANNQRQSTILVADGSTWQVLSRYRADAQYEDITIDYMGVTSTGPAANFTSGAAVGTDGVSGGVAIVQSSDSDCRTFSVRGSTSLPSGVSQTAEVDLSTSPITVPKGSTTYVCLLGRLANTVASSTNPDVTGAPRSGNVVALGIPAGALTVGGSASSIFTSALFAGNLDIRATGAASGDRVYQAGSQSLGNAFVVRRAVPVVTQQNTGLSTTLASGQRTLYRAQIGSQGGQASIKQLTFKVAVTTTSNMTLANFRLQKNGADMNSSDVSITDAYGVNLQTTTMDVHTSPATTTVMVIVRFASEETVSGTGNTYALNATIGGLSSATGDSITTALANRTFSGTVAANAITGYLAQGSSQITVESEDAGLVGLATSTAPSTSVSAGDFAYGMLWSDMSEGPHYANIITGSEAASRDWTNEYLVNTISGSMVMSK